MHLKWNHSVGQPGLSQAIILSTRVTGLHSSLLRVEAIFYNLALMGISLIDCPVSVTYEGWVFVDFSVEQWLVALLNASLS